MRMRITTVPPAAACDRRIGVIAAIIRQIGRMRPTRGRRAADAPADYDSTLKVGTESTAPSAAFVIKQEMH